MVDDEHYSKIWDIFWEAESTDTLLRTVFKDGDVFIGTVALTEHRYDSDSGDDEITLLGLDNDTYCSFTPEEVESVEVIHK